jgi:hypothetical protein
MAKYKVATFGKSAFRGLKSKPRDPAEELQELLDAEPGELVGVVPAPTRRTADLPRRRLNRPAPQVCWPPSGPSGSRATSTPDGV